MRYISFTFIIFLLIFVSTIFAQTRDKAINEIFNLKQKAAKLEKIILQPALEDMDVVAAENLNVFRLLPREKYDKELLNTRGGGAYYSFTTKSHSYNDTPQISLEQNNLKVGFYGASYGLIADLGNSPQIAEQTPEYQFLTKYNPPKIEKEIRDEAQKAYDYQTDNLSFKSRVPVTVGNSYLLRAISFDEADTLVWFKVHRQDSDGSLIIFWKPLKDFKTPQITTDEELKLKTKAEKMYKQKGLYNIKVEVAGGIITLSGTVPRERLAEAVMSAHKLGARRVDNQLSIQ
jgi:hypothetical protein